VARRTTGVSSLARKDRLGGSEFQALFQERARREESPSFVALWRAREGGGKVGFAVGRRIGGAVDRNRARRRLREAYRRGRGTPPPTGFDIVFVGRPAVLTRSFSDLLEEMQHAMQAVARAASGVARVGAGRKSGS
jgi:ribonuclease P protein component